MSTHFNELTPAEAERLALLAEECGETIQAIGKILRHGYESVNPKQPDSLTNRANLTREIGDVQLAINKFIEHGDIDRDDVAARVEQKAKSVGPYLHHQPEYWHD